MGLAYFGIDAAVGVVDTGDGVGAFVSADGTGDAAIVA